MEASTWRLIGVVIVVSLGTSFHHYSVSVVNNPEEIVIRWINQSYWDHYHSQPNMRLLWSLVSSMFFIGAIPGSLLIRFAAEIKGRRTGLLVASVLGVAGGALSGLSRVTHSFEMLILGRFTLGISGSIGMGVGSMFLTEIPPANRRGACGGILPVGLGFGQFLALVVTLPSVLGTEKLWPIAFAMPAVPSMILFLIMLKLPDSPRFTFLVQDDLEKTQNSLLFYQGPNNQATMHSLHLEMGQLKNHSDQGHTYIDLWRCPLARKLLLASITAVSGLTMAGRSPMLAYSTDIFVLLDFPSANSTYASASLGLCFFLLPILMIYPVERFGRRPLILIGLTGIGTSMAIFSFLSKLREVHDEAPWIAPAIGFTLLLYVISFTIQSPVPFMITSELFDQQHRANANTVAYTAMFILQALVIFIYFPLKARVGVAYSFIPFAAGPLICACVLHLVLPETKGRIPVPMTSAKIDV